MNCENCQELLSEFLDESLDFAEHSEIEVHIQECAVCFGTHRELASILNFCETMRDDLDSPPNSQALWLRISNLIESENQSSVEHLRKDKRQSWWGRLSNSTLQFSLPQLVSSVVAIAVVAALFTAIGLRGITDKQTNNDSVASSYSDNLEDRMSRRQQVIDYWNQRVEARKTEWDSRTRDAFDRNLRILDETVAQYKEALIQNPHDEIYEEALNSAMNEKLELLKEFSEL